VRNRVIGHSLFTEFDIYLFKSGKHTKLYEKMGAHYIEVDGVGGTYFAVFAPAARSVQVIGNFNAWNGGEYELNVRWDSSGIWEGFIPDVGKGELYKYRIASNYDALIREKSDPYGFFFEKAPKTAAITWDTDYKWKDKAWINKRTKKDLYSSTMSIYEVHIGSWRKNNEGNSLSYSEMATELVDYVKEMAYTHVEMLPVTEHPYFPSWGYLTTGFFAPTSRFGSPQEFMELIDAFHKAGIGVLVDWVPAHFPSDDGWLADFDGSHVYEHPNPKRGFHPDWNSLIFNYERSEVRSFLLSCAHFWLDRYHIDGLRVDAVASMLYLDYSREDGEWDPNIYGGNENLEAISFLKDLNESVYKDHPGVVMIAEESTAFAGVTKPVSDGGLGFGFKWMMGWMNDTLEYMKRDPIHRQYHHNEISFSMAYAYSENFVLPLSHDEVVHGKQSLIYKMPGDEWQKMANVRLLYSYMYGHPGHKLLFMGNEIGQTTEWDLDTGVRWDLLEYKLHKGIQVCVSDLNHLLAKQPALSEKNFSHEGFEWIDHGDHQNSVLSFIRKGKKQQIMVVCNFTPNVQSDYRLGVNEKGKWTEIFNSDSEKYGGSNQLNDGVIKTQAIESHGKENSVSLVLPPLGVVYLKYKK